MSRSKLIHKNVNLKGGEEWSFEKWSMKLRITFSRLSCTLAFVSFCWKGIYLFHSFILPSIPYKQQHIGVHPRRLTAWTWTCWFGRCFSFSRGCILGFHVNLPGKNWPYWNSTNIRSSGVPNPERCSNRRSTIELHCGCLVNLVNMKMKRKLEHVVTNTWSYNTIQYHS